MISARGANASRGRHWRADKPRTVVVPAENGMEKVGGGCEEGGGRNGRQTRRIPRKIYSAETGIA